MENPYFHIFRSAFLVLGQTQGENEGTFDGAAIEQYGDTLVEDLFELQRDVPGIETEAALILNVWMAVINELFQAKIHCRSNSMNKALESLDRAAALWIGEGQVTGLNEGGHMLYSLTENAGDRFGQDNGEAIVNSKIIDLFVEIQKDIKSDQCSNISGYLNNRREINRMVSLMTIPLVQNLIHHSMTVSGKHGDDWVELYALATIPRVAVCNPDAYDELLRLNVIKSLTPEYANQALSALERSYSCFRITCADVGAYRGGERQQCQDVSGVNIVGYASDREDIRERSYLDRDIKEIDVFMRFKAYGLAFDWYQYGWNSVYNLRGLAKNEIIPPVDSNMFETFSEYFEGPDFADDYLTAQMEQLPPYNEATTEQSRLLVTSYLSYVVMFFSSASALQYATEQCSVDTDTAGDYWDTGAMFYIGSMEGELPQGSDGGGLLLFSTAKDMCEEFGTCLDYSEVGGTDIPKASSNEIVISKLNEGVDLIRSNKCTLLRDILADLLAAMPIPLLQGTVKYASFIAGLPAASGDTSLALADSFSKSIVPLIDVENEESALTIEDAMEYSPSKKPGDYFVVINALRDALVDMNIQCDQVGDFVDEAGDANLCASTPTVPGQSMAPVLQPTPAPKPTEPGSADAITWGRFTFSSPNIALADAKYAQDVRDMYEATNITAATTVYTQGKNAVAKGLDGATKLVSLQSLSVESSTFMGEDLLYNVYKWALYDDDAVQQGTFQYADEVIQEALTNGNDMRLAAEGTVIMNIWMLMVHRLYESIRLCKQKQSPLELIDSVVALWIGDEQVEGKYDDGWMLYSVAQSAAEYFGYPEGEASINTQLMALFNRAQSIGQTCANDSDAPTLLRAHVFDIIRRLTVPLVTSLLFHMVANSKNMVELYAVAVIPQVYSCDGDAALNLERILYQGYEYSSAVDDELLSDLTTFLRCKRITCQDIRVSANAESDKLKSLTNTLCERLEYWEQQGMELPMAGYIPNKDVTEIARLDLDVIEIEMMSELGAFKAAMDVYQNGHNSFQKPDGTLWNLQSLARMPSLDEGIMFHVYSGYYDSLDFADQMVLNALNGSEDFVSASWKERSEVASRAIQTMVVYTGVQARLQEAVKYCNDEKIGLAQLKWNEAAALWIGSAEGLVAAAKQDVGRFMYSLANDACEEFQSCADNGEALVNQIVLEKFASGRDSIADGQCSHIERTMKEDIVPRMPIPLIQSLISNALAHENANDDNKYDHATIYVLAKALIPLVKEADESSSMALESMYGDFNSIVAGQPANDAINALGSALRPMGIDCSEVGTLDGDKSWSKCAGSGGGIDADGDGDVGGDGEKDGDAAPLPDTPTSLGDDLYVTTTFVKDKANIGLDIRDMENQLKAGNPATAKQIYESGENSEIFDSNGKYVSLRTLKGFSIDSSEDMAEDPLFNLYLYALADESGNFMQTDAKYYANSYVQNAFDQSDTSATTLPAEAAVALNVWMELAHQLYESVSLCQRNEIRDEDGIQSIDIAAAYWIGEGLPSSEGENGHLMYALAEEMGAQFNVVEGGQSRTNRNILRLFNEAKTELSLPNACSENPATHVNLRHTVNKIISLMAVPLLQSLIHNLRMNDLERVKLYGHAVVPLAAGCNPTAYVYLKDRLLTGDFNAVDIEKIVETLRSIYPCLGLACDDIGIHESEVSNAAQACVDPDGLESLAGYSPTSDVQQVCSDLVSMNPVFSSPSHISLSSMIQLARIDLDIREIDILMRMNAYKAAEDIYMYGKNVEGSNGGSMSLSQIATTSERSIVPQYDAFSRFYDDGSFVDKAIRAALRGDGIWNKEQRNLLVLKSLQANVMYFGALQAVYEAVSDCSATVQYRSSGGQTDAWDRAAAFLIGSLEGTEPNGSAEGYLFYSLAQEHCMAFGTCDDPNATVEVNQRLIKLLYSGRGAVLGNSCNGLRKVADELSSLLLVPTIQGALITSIRLTGTKPLSKPIRRAEAYVYSRALLPIVDDIDRDASSVIEENLGDRSPASTKQIASHVFSAFAKVYPGMGVDCELIGKTDDFDPCAGVVKGASSSGATLWIIIGVAIAVVLAGGWCFLRRHQGKKRLPENNPKFVVSEGEFNNHSMNLLEKAFANHTAPNTPEERSRLTGGFSEPEIKLVDDDDDDFDEAEALNGRDSTPDII
eukprot:scaffold12195_cov126-Cylindrotheca_fusiformis.AAC.2